MSLNGTTRLRQDSVDGIDVLFDELLESFDVTVLVGRVGALPAIFVDERVASGGFGTNCWVRDKVSFEKFLVASGRSNDVKKRQN